VSALQSEPLFSSSIFCKTFSKSNVTVKVAGNLIRVIWNEKLSKQVNTAEEDLFIEVRKKTKELPILEKKVSHLLSTEFHLDADGPIQLRLIKKKHYQLHLSTSFHYTPKVVLVSENERRHHLKWMDIDWEHIQREVEISSGLDWEKDIDIFLHVIRWPEPSTGLKEQEWIHTGLSSHTIVLGALKEVSLIIAPKKGTGKPPSLTSHQILKTLFRLVFKLPEVVRELAFLDFETGPSLPFMELKREIWEGDTVQLRAWWNIPDECWKKVEKDLLAPKGLDWKDVDICIQLNQLEPHPIFQSTNWLFLDIQDGSAYQAALVIRPKKGGNKYLGPAVITSNIASVPAKPDQIVLLPIDEKRLFTYWHLDAERLSKRLDTLSGGDPAKVRTCIRLFHDWAGDLHHHTDVEVNLGFSDNWYLPAAPDRVYRVQLVAVSDKGKIKSLTDVSNPVQTIRVSPGGNPVSYKEVDLIIEHPTQRELMSVMETAKHSIGLELLHLHAHLPYFRRRVAYGMSGIWQPMGFPEEWFHEAIRETYVPLILTFERLRSEGVDFRISMDISPTLTNMMRCPLLQEEFLRYMEAHISLARAEVDRTGREAHRYHETAWMHLNRFLEVRDCFMRYGGDLTRALKKLQDEGYIEISTCGATHAFLPFFTAFPESVRGQIQTAVLDYRDVFGRDPIGIWLPECAYVPGIEKWLEEAGLNYFFSETHAVLHADSPAAFGTHAPVYLKGSNVAAFARDPETGRQVWSGDEGYPGDPYYLEFHIRGGPLKYNRITSRRSDYKEPYVRAWALEKAAKHAQHFMESRNFRFNYIKNWFWKKPLVVAMYDAELFGHHWYEGTDFLYYLLKKLYYNQSETELITPSAYLARYPRNQEAFITPSSWGEKGTFDKWIYGSVSWMYKHSHEAIRELHAMAADIKANRQEDQLAKRIVSQAAREVLQSMNSDIPFVISNGHFVDRMKEFFFEDLERFWILASLYWKGGKMPGLTACRLQRLEMENPIFSKIDPFAFAP
jgi:1,4-alpha-glucan branching enzyme